MLNALVDSGPLIALFNARDNDHARAVAFFEQHGSALRIHTTWEVISEVMYFLNWSAAAQGDFLDWLHAACAAELATVTSLTVDDLPALSKLMRKYADRPMDLADASLVKLAGDLDLVQILTLDRADFSVYRTTKRRAFKNIFA